MSKYEQWMQIHLACMGSQQMTNKGHKAQQLQIPLVTVVVILHDN